MAMFILRVKHWIVRQLLRLFGMIEPIPTCEHAGLDAWLASPDAKIACQAFDRIFAEHGHYYDERQLLEQAYNYAQRTQCHLAGYELRFILYWCLGCRRGKWY